MKTNKIKPQKKASLKAVKKKLEKSLADKFIEAVKGLGHNAEDIAVDIAKLSRVAAKKLSKKFQEVKSVVEQKIDDVSTAKDTASKKIKLGKKETSKLMKKVDKSVTKVVKKAVAKSKPVATSVKVQEIASAQSAAAAIRPLSKTKTDSNMAKKVTTPADSAKKAVVKAVSNNPVKKVSTKQAIPAKKNTTTNDDKQP
jgi:hypothetical protein